jgi:phage head maturation protease
MKHTIQDNQKIQKIFTASETKAVEGEDRVLTVKISTKNPDRSKDEVMPEGMIAENYLKNPVVAAFHNYHEPAIAKTLELTQTGDGIVAKLQFTPAGVNKTADMLYDMYKGGFMNAWSIGFIPKRYEQKEDHGYIIREWELLEYSAVLVPDNPEALTMLRSKGLNTDDLMEKEIAPDSEKNEDSEKEDIKDGDIEDKKEVTLKDLLTEEAVKALDDESKKLLAEWLISEDQLNKLKFLEQIREVLKKQDKGVGLLLRDINNYIKTRKGGE